MGVGVLDAIEVFEVSEVEEVLLQSELELRAPLLIDQYGEQS